MPAAARDGDRAARESCTPAAAANVLIVTSTNRTRSKHVPVRVHGSDRGRQVELIMN